MLSLKNDSLKIAISRGDNTGSYPKYKEWLQHINSDIELINLYGKTAAEANAILVKCFGLVLSGGNDIHPKFYNNTRQLDNCIDIDETRDKIEIELIKKALELKLPVLGICRGLQILNVALGGSLITDIPTEYKDTIKHSLKNEARDQCFHKITIEENSLLYSISGKKNEIVNSYHHQAIDKLSELLKITAVADDNITEAVEWKSENNKSFLLAVQWHPERENKTNEISLHIAQAFIDATTNYKVLHP